MPGWPCASHISQGPDPRLLRRAPRIVRNPPSQCRPGCVHQPSYSLVMPQGGLRAGRHLTGDTTCDKAHENHSPGVQRHLCPVCLWPCGPCACCITDLSPTLLARPPHCPEKALLAGCVGLARARQWYCRPSSPTTRTSACSHACPSWSVRLHCARRACALFCGNPLAPQAHVPHNYYQLSRLSAQAAHSQRPTYLPTYPYPYCPQAVIATCM